MHNMERSDSCPMKADAARKGRCRLLAFIAAVAVVSACATPSPRTSVVKTVNNMIGDSPYQSVLVISAAGDRASRNQFEQEMTAVLTNEDLTATPYFSVVGRVSEISRNAINIAVRVREFDAILLVRQLGQEFTVQDSNRPTGRGFDLFKYDYDELNDLSAIENGSTMAFVAEVYDTAKMTKIWAIESLVFSSETVESGVSSQVAIIDEEIIKDRVLAR